ncbi:pyroglutamyl-peptidase I [Planctomonas sp. JC2975]|uniref:pyroglutamyl-peptidase I n=1 Tax=Planctomonas sp. JC2975 TaxID=2729626 RepID=UPI001474DD98|nr:pyroglutamyl-peptidase I [Planctomonas sp. JC2975]NNC13244.1 pyroglutamyl-peptidase I [Planctomonas sp. JC2975]
MTTVLLTGFEPFGSDAVNPSGDAVRLVASRWRGPERLVTDILPVAFRGSVERLTELIETNEPDVVIATGLAGGRSKVSVERVGVNLIDARIPDNDGDQPVDVPSLADAQAAVFASLPVKAIVRDIAAAGIPVALSLSAGSYVCNHVLVHAASWAQGSDRRAGFIHVPWAVGQATNGEPELPLDDLARAIEIAVRTTLSTRADIDTAGGTLH